MTCEFSLLLSLPSIFCPTYPIIYGSGMLCVQLKDGRKSYIHFLRYKDYDKLLLVGFQHELFRQQYNIMLSSDNLFLHCLSYQEYMVAGRKYMVAKKKMSDKKTESMILTAFKNCCPYFF